MNGMTWVPFGVDTEIATTLVDGTPQWMVTSFLKWFESQWRTYQRYDYNPADGRYVERLERMRRMELATRLGPYADVLYASGSTAVWKRLSEPERLRVFDWLIRDNVENQEAGNEELERILRDGGSKWKVGVRNGVPGLEARVPEGVQDAADAAMSIGGEAGRLLSEAWHAVYGVSPQPDLGYRKSLEAVEAAVLPRVMPKDATATLGKAIGQMRSQGDWKLPFDKEHPQNLTQDVVLGMLQALWSGHSDRHPGTPGYVPSTPEAAEAAVSLAVTLISLFSNGGIARRQ